MPHKTKPPSPPQWADKLLEWLCPYDLLEEVQGDLHELFEERLEEVGEKRARKEYFLSVLGYMRPWAFKRNKPSATKPLYLDMLQKNFTLAFRNLQKQKVIAGINVLGLGMGMACCILVFLYVGNELNYDTHHVNYKHVYRMLQGGGQTGQKSAVLPGALYNFVKNEIPQVERAARIHRAWESIITYQKDQYIESNFLFADASILDIFTLPLIKGNKENALALPTSVLITEQAAKKYFGTADPIGKTIRYNHEYDFTITGVLADIPPTSHFHADFIASMPAMKHLDPGLLEDWSISGTYLYLLLNKETDIKMVEQKLFSISLKHNSITNKAPQANLQNKVYLEPLSDIHLLSAGTTWDIADKGDIAHILVFIVIACLIVSIACFNFVNLTTANAAKRAKEIGIKKVLGVSRNQLIIQFYSETLLYIVFAWIIAFVIATLSIPYFNQLFGKSLSLQAVFEGKYLLILLGISLGIFFLAGSYPAFYLSGLQPIVSLKNKGMSTYFSKSKSVLSLMQFLVIGQFSIAIILIVSSLLISNQIKFMTEKKVGFDTEHVLIINNPWDDEMTRRYERYVTRVSSHIAIDKIASAHMVPAAVITSYTDIHLPGTSKEEAVHAGKISVSHAFFETIGAVFIEGRNFSKGYATDAREAVILNETAAQALGRKSPIGTMIKVGFSEKPMQVIGVIKDIQYESLHQRAKPSVYFVESPANQASIFLKIKPGEITPTLQYLEEEWKKVTDKWPFQYQFMNERLQNVYQAELRVNKLVKIFTGLTILISCMGLFGLASFMAVQRTKEIGIRKVLGATGIQIAALLSKDFLRLILLSNLIAWPIAYVVMSHWLENFAYQVNISPWVFAIAGAAALVIALLTISVKAIKAALVNPVKSLRNE
jgi:putative ABC transport system permease protein